MLRLNRLCVRQVGTLCSRTVVSQTQLWSATAQLYTPFHTKRPRVATLHTDADVEAEGVGQQIAMPSAAKWNDVKGEIHAVEVRGMLWLILNEVVAW